MDITIDRSGRGQKALKDRIAEIQKPTIRLVNSRLPGRVPYTEIILTDTAGMLRLSNTYQNQLAAGASLRNRLRQRVVDNFLHRGALATTVLTPSGVAVVIDGTKHRAIEELDRTFVHEMAHVIQLGYPEVRRRHIDYIRQCLGVDELDKAAIKEEERLMDIHEQQAENLEVLAKQLPGRN